MPKRYPFYLVLTWFCALALWLIWWGLPNHSMVIWVGTLSIIGIGIFFGMLHFIRLNRERVQVSRTLGASFAELENASAGAREDAIYVLVIGDDNYRVFGETPEKAPLVVYSDNTFWIRITSPSSLAPLARAITRWRAGRKPEALMLAVAPEFCEDSQKMASSLQAWRYAAADVFRRLGSVLPCFISVYTRHHKLAEKDYSRRGWFGFAAEEARHWTDLSSLREQIEKLRDNLDFAAQEAPPALRFSLAVRGAKSQTLLTWINEMILPPLYGPRTGLPAIPLNGLILIEGDFSESADSHWGRWQYMKSALVPKTVKGAEAGALPPQISLNLPKKMPRSQWLRAICHMCVMAAVAISVAMVSSAWQNRLLADRIFGDIEIFYKADPENQSSKKAALAVLEEDRRELYSYKLSGPPLYLGWKLYRGLEILPTLEKAIASYVPPPPPPPEVVYVTKEAPAPMVLDSVALFDSGKAVLKAGTDELLLPVLAEVKAHADQFFLVTGHTDNVGGHEYNQKLSEARAITVRNWLAEQSGLSVSRFGIHGYGDVRPLADNDTEEGKAKNRRVEVTIVPNLITE